MGAQQQLLELYQQWRALTEIEGGAITAADWENVAQAQRQKQLLQAQITQASDALQAELPARGLDRDAWQPIREVVAELICLEQKNQEALAQQRSLGEQRRVELHQISRNLHQLHKAYVPEQQPQWHSYS